jgi:hypothetical protein
MEKRRRLEQTLVWLDAFASLIMASGVGWFLYISNEAAADAVRRYGRNVDSGALEYVAAIVYFMPNAIGFAVASVAMGQRWVIRWPAQGVAIFWLVAPVVMASIPWTAR